MFGRDVTIFSKQGAIWYPRVFNDAQVAEDRGYIRRVYGETSNEVVSVHIKRINGLAEGKYTVYEPKAWNALQTIPTDAVSFKDEDVIMLADWSEVDNTLSPISDDDYAKGFYNWLRKTHDCVYAITNTAKFTALPHWEIAGR